MNAHEMVKKNNEWRKQLTPENGKYYENLMYYVRIDHAFNKKAEEFLQEVLDHLLQAMQIIKKGWCSKHPTF